MSETAGPSPQAYSKLAELELEFDKAEEELCIAPFPPPQVRKVILICCWNDTVKHQIELFDPIYVRRGAVLDTIQSFWTTILENFSPDIDEHITTEDWVFLGENITSINVTRPEKDTNPRTFEIEIGFKPDNGVVATTRLQKRFTYKALRSGDERWSGLVSEPVVVPWIDDKKDLTGGINALAIKIFELRKKRAEKHIAEKKEAANSGASKKSGAVKEDDGLADLEREMEEKLNQNQSFFNWFSWTGNHFMVMEREAEMKIKEEADKSKAKEGEEEEDDDEEDSDGADDGIDVFPYGEKLAYLIAEDLFPNALKHFGIPSQPVCPNLEGNLLTLCGSSRCDGIRRGPRRGRGRRRRL